MSRLLHHSTRRWSLVTLLIVLAAMFAPAGPAAPALAAPAARPAPQSAGTLQFLRDNPDLRGQIEDADAWAVGGGYLYWAKCSSSPARAGIAPSAIGYLRRWPLRGGRAVTLSNAATCIGDSMAADMSGVYYHDSAAQAIIFRSASDPLTPRTVAASQRPTGPIVLDNGDTFWGDYIFWLENGYIRNAYKADFTPAGRPEPAGVNARSLMLDGTYLLWFGDGRLATSLKYCLAIGGGACVKDTVANETGDYLVNAERRGPLIGHRVHPMWVGGSSIRGIWCRPGTPPGPITVCSPSTSYTAPTLNGNPYVPGRLAGDGDYLFWVESNMACGGFGCSPNAEGRLMKWNLKPSLFGNNPFDTPQPIACHDCGAAYTISRNEQIAVADGWVYFDTSNGISRIRADAPPVAWDLAVSAWEVTQGIQSTSNNVQLIADKPTYVRLYGDKLSGPNVFGVDARLYGRTAAGAPLPGSPLNPINGTQSFTANNAGPKRADPNGGWIFRLPDDWVHAGAITLSPLIDPRQVWNDPNRANNFLADQSFSFTRKAPVCIVFIPVRTNPAVQMFTSPHWFAIDMIRRVLPTPDVWVYHQDDDVAELEIKWGGPFNAIPYPGYGPYEMADDSWKVLLSLWTRDQLSDDPDRCDNARARTHYVGVVNPNAGGSNGSGRLGGDQLWFRLPPDDLSRDWMTDRAVTLPHELGHNYGRRHVDCPPGDPDDTGFYPYPSCQLDQDDGIARHYGFTYNARSGRFETILPTSAGDLMSYSHRRSPPLPRWISDFTWGGIQNEIPNGAAAQATLAATPQQHVPNLAAASSVVLISGAVNTVTPAQSALEHAWVFPSGSVSQAMLRKWQRTAAAAADPALASTSAAGAYHLRLIGTNGAVLDDRAITLGSDSDESGPMRTFLMTFPAPAAAVARIELADGATVLTKLQPGASPPTISILSPANGGTFDSKMTVSWRASDPDRSDLLLYTVQYSPDNGSTWRTVLANFPNLSGTDTATVDLKSLSGLPASTTGGRIRVLASDGYHTTMAVSKPFTVPNRAPQPTIITPWPGQSIPAGQTVVLQGMANDAEDGGLSGASLRWTLDGKEIGTGQLQTIAGLAPGKYTVGLTARDSAGREQTSSAALTIEALRIPLGSAPTLDGECSDDAYTGATQVQIAPYADGSQATAQLIRTASDLWICFSNMARAGGTSPGSLAAVRIDANYSRDAQIQPGDYVLVLGEDGVLTTYDGNTTPGPGGIAVRVSANQSTWQAEWQIPASVLGGWNHVVGMDVEHAWVNAVADDYFWPYSATWNNPSSWAATALGDVPRLTALTPASATAGGAGFTLTVNGTNFAAGAKVRWNGAIRSTTVVSSTQVRASISAADIARAGTAAVTVANPELSAAPSNALAFSISSPAPTEGGPRRLFLPLVRR